MAESNFNGTWTLSHAEYQELKRRSEWLGYLEAAGLDNWSGVEVAMDMRDAEEEV